MKWKIIIMVAISIAVSGILLNAQVYGPELYDTNYTYVVESFAGSGVFGFMDGQGTQSMFKSPGVVIADSSNKFYRALLLP